MTTPVQAWERFAVPDRVTVGRGPADLPCLTLRTPWSAAVVFAHGAHLTEFAWHDEPPLLFLSARSRYGAGQAIRGGVPVIFPWFGNRDSLPAHGFARTATWTLAETRAEPDGGVAVSFTLDRAPAGVTWPPFAVRYTIRVGRHLEMTLGIDNPGVAPLAVEHCLHTYLLVGDVAQASVTGLTGRRYVDKTDGFKTKVDDAASLRIAGETDRVYPDAPGVVAVDDPVLRRRLRVEQTGARSTVVWNPWAEKARAMADLDDYRRLLCVESGNVGDAIVTIAPGGRHVSRAVITREPLA